MSYKVVFDENGNVKLECPTIVKQFAAEKISAPVLRKLVEDASKFLNDEVITCLRTSMICEGWQPKMQATLQG